MSSSSRSSSVLQSIGEGFSRFTAGIAAFFSGAGKFMREFFKIDTLFPQDYTPSWQQATLRLLAMMISLGFSLTCILTAGAGFMNLMGVLLPMLGLTVAPMTLFAIGIFAFGIISGAVNWNLSVVSITQMLMHFFGGKLSMLSRKCLQLVDSSSPETPNESPKYCLETVQNVGALQQQPSATGDEKAKDKGDESQTTTSNASEVPLYMSGKHIALLLFSLVPAVASGFTIGGLTFLLCAPIVGLTFGYVTFGLAAVAISILTFGTFYNIIREKSFLDSLTSFGNSILNYLKKVNYNIQLKTLERHGINKREIFGDIAVEEKTADELFKIVNDKLEQLNKDASNDSGEESKTLSTNNIASDIKAINNEILLRQILISLFSGIFGILLVFGLLITLVDSSVPGIQSVLAGMGVPAGFLSITALTISSIAFFGETVWYMGLAVDAARSVSNFLCDGIISIKEFFTGGPRHDGVMEVKGENASSASKLFYRFIQLVNATINMILSLTAFISKIATKTPLTMGDQLKNGFGAPGAFTASFTAGNGGLPKGAPTPADESKFVPAFEWDKGKDFNRESDDEAKKENTSSVSVRA